MVAYDRDRWVVIDGVRRRRAHVEGPPADKEGPSDTYEVDATEGAIELANQLGVDLAQVAGSGKDGRILKADVEAHA